MKLHIAETKFDKTKFWNNTITDRSEYPIWFAKDALSLFDQNGYHLTLLEQKYAESNGYPLKDRRHETLIRQDWIVDTSIVAAGPHINHSDIFERKSYSDEAEEQLINYARKNTLLWKLIKMKSKWGIDISIDYTDYDGNVFEVFHYEWDSFDYDPIIEKKLEIEKFVLNTDWDDAAQTLLKRRDEWQDLEFLEQSKWRTDFFGLSPEKFKNVIWEQ